MLKILFTGGGTGGHIYPIVAVARELRTLAQKDNIPLEMVFAGPADFDLDIVRQEGLKVYRVPSGKLRRYASLKAPWDIIKIIAGFFYSLALVWWIMPDAIFSKGGYGAFSIGFVGRLYAAPLLVHDSDSIPGLVSRILGKIASRVAISFPDASRFFPGHKTAFLGNPIRTALFNGSKERAKITFQLKGDKPIILVLGGSQGSVRLNEAAAGIIKDMLTSYEIIHQVGSLNVEEFGKEEKEVFGVDSQKEPYYHTKGYLNEEEIADALAAADVVVSRAGASSIYEIAAAGKPSILVPFSDAAFDHQRENAFYYGRSGAAVVIEEANMSPHLLLGELKGILESKNRQLNMAKAAKEFAKPDAAAKIAQGLLELAVG